MAAAAHRHHPGPNFWGKLGTVNSGYFQQHTGGGVESWGGAHPGTESRPKAAETWNGHFCMKFAGVGSVQDPKPSRGGSPIWAGTLSQKHHPGRIKQSPASPLLVQPCQSLNAILEEYRAYDPNNALNAQGALQLVVVVSADNRHQKALSVVTIPMAYWVRSEADVIPVWYLGGSQPNQPEERGSYFLTQEIHPKVPSPPFQGRWGRVGLVGCCPPPPGPNNLCSRVPSVSPGGHTHTHTHTCTHSDT